MKSCAFLIAGLLLLMCLTTRAEDAPKSAPAAKAGSADTAAVPTEPSLRKPGFIFMELSTTRGDEYFSFFESVAGFRILQQEPGYIVARSDLAELSFIDPKFWAHGHPFSGKLTGNGAQGVGIEIGIVVADIDKAYAEAVKFKDKGFPISTGIVRRPWGSRDFRVLVPEGYYFRFTEGH